MKSLHEIAYHLVAHRPIIWVETYEEERFIEDLSFLIEDAKDGTSIIENVLPTSLHKYNLRMWSCTSGLFEIDLSSEGLKGEEVKDSAGRSIVSIKKVLDMIEDDHQKQSRGEDPDNIYILKDVHQFLTSSHEARRTIRDIKEYSRSKDVPIIILSPIIDIPFDLEKIITVVSYDLPTKEEIAELIEASVNNLKEINKKRKEVGAEEGVKKLPSEEEQKALVQSCLGLTRSEIIHTSQYSLQRFNEISSKAVLEEKVQLIKKSGLLDYKIPEAKFENIGGNDNFKNWIKKIETSFTEEAKEYGLTSPKGYVALGVPGSSKTIGAEALANKMDLPLLKLNMSKILDRLVGSSERNIERAFKLARACSPCILLVDEMEKNFGGVNSSNHSDGGTLNRVSGKLLEFMNEDNDVFVIMTANDVSQMPPEMTRVGRVDAIWYFGLPTPEERKEIFKIHLDLVGKKYNEQAIEMGIQETDNYTGAEIEAVVKFALRESYRRYIEEGKKDSEILPEDIKAASTEVIPIHKSSREKIQALEDWVGCNTKDKQRARRASASINYNYKKEKKFATNSNVLKI